MVPWNWLYVNGGRLPLSSMILAGVSSEKMNLNKCWEFVTWYSLGPFRATFRTSQDCTMCARRPGWPRFQAPYTVVLFYDRALYQMALDLLRMLDTSFLSINNTKTIEMKRKINPHFRSYPILWTISVMRQPAGHAQRIGESWFYANCDPGLPNTGAKIWKRNIFNNSPRRLFHFY